MKFIVTAGGQGKKLWPYSRVAFPKQFQKIVGQESLYEKCVRTLLKHFPAKDIYISTKKSYTSIAKKQVPEIPNSNYLFEPDSHKDRGPAEGLAFLYMSVLHPKEPFMIIQPDCIRTPEESFINMIKLSEKVVKRDRKFLTGGIKATSPVMGVDYLELGERLKLDSSIEVYEGKGYLPRSKDIEKTKEMIEGYHVVIHCNHCCWYPDLMLSAYKKYRPDWYNSLMDIKKYVGLKDAEKKIEEIYSTMEKGSTEEVTKNLIKEGYVVLLPFKWTDIGTWSSYYEFFAKPGRNLVDGNVVVLNSSGSLIKSVKNKKIVVAYGIQDLAVIETDDVLFVLPLKETGKVNDIINELEKQGHKELI